MRQRLLAMMILFTSVFAFSAENSKNQDLDVIDIDVYVDKEIEYYDQEDFKSIELKIEEPLVDYSWKDAGIDAALWGGILSTKDHLPDDKYKHLVSGALIGYSGYAIGKVVFKNSKHPELYAKITAVTLAAVAAAAKEAYDSTKDSNGNPRGHVEFNDFLATTAGGAIVALRFNIKF